MKKFIAFVSILLLAFSCAKVDDVPVSLTLKSSATESVDANGGSVVIEFSTNQADWGYDLDGASWISASPSSSSLALNVQANTSEQARTANIKIIAPKDGGSKSSSVSVRLTQSGARFDPKLTLSLTGMQNVPAEASTLDVDVTTNMESFEVESAFDWISSKVNGNRITFSFAANSKEVAREGEITVYAPSKKSFMARAKLQFTQAATVIDHPKESLSGSNCFLVSHKGLYSIDATVRGNGKGCEGLDAPSSLSPAGAKLVWQDHKGMVKSVALEDGNIVFELSGINGNALFAATDKAGNIIWSWHVWYPEDNVQTLSAFSGMKMMSMNLGAMKENDPVGVESFGLLYQWGRKDPFPGSPIPNGGAEYTKNASVYDIDGKEVQIMASSMQDLKSNYLAFSIANPMVCISNNKQFAKTRDWLQPEESNGSLWGNPKGAEKKDAAYPNKGVKTFYDPCPVGWHVPSPELFRDMTSTGGMIWVEDNNDVEGVMNWVQMFGEAEFAGVDINKDGRLNILDYKNGWYLYLDRSKKTTYSYFPATTRYDGQYAMLMGSMVGLWANYWCNAPSLDDDGRNLSTAFSYMVKDYGRTNYTITASGASNGARADAYAVRCVKE